MLGVAAGMLWAGSNGTIKALSGKTGELGAGVVLHPFALVIGAAAMTPPPLRRPAPA